MQFVDKKDDKSRTLLRLLQMLMETIGVPAIPSSMYIPGDLEFTSNVEDSGTFGRVRQARVGNANLLAVKRLINESKFKVSSLLPQH